MSPPVAVDLMRLVAILAEAARGNPSRQLPLPDADHELRPLLEAFNAVLDAWRKSELKARSARRELQEKLGTIEAQAAAIRELSMPVLAVADHTLLVPIVGELDARRGADLLTSLLQEVHARNADLVLLDITGVDVVDSTAADTLVRIARALRLLGARCMLTGVQPAVAQTLVTLGIELQSMLTLRTLQEGLQQRAQDPVGRQRGT